MALMNDMHAEVDQAVLDELVAHLRDGIHNQVGNVPHLADYFGIWSIHTDTFTSLVDQVKALDLNVHVQNAGPIVQQRDASQRNFAISDDGIAMFQISGPMMKAVASLSEGTSTVRLRQQIKAARRDPAVRGAILSMDTPGGTVKGNRDLADEIAAFNAEKPIYAYIEDMNASAGVSVASQCRHISANNATALYGAMGTFSVIYDASGMAQQKGIQVHVIKAGKFKGVGTPGTPITDEQLQEMQRIVNALNEAYLGMIATGRGMNLEQVRSLADGRLHTAADAMGMGLIDAVESFENTKARLLAELDGTGASGTRSSVLLNAADDDGDDPDEGDDQEPDEGKDNNMADKNAASLADLKATFPDSTADWRESQLEAGASLTDAALSYASFVQEQSKKREGELQKQLEEAQVKNTAQNSGLGHQPLQLSDEGSTGPTGDAIADFNSAVAAMCGPNPSMEKRQGAIRAVANQQPQLYQAYLLAANPGRKQRRQIVEKLATD